VHIQRIGFTPVKGGRHLTHELVDLTAGGPAGDRVFALVDRSRGRVLRTVENPTLIQASSAWDAGILSVDLPGHTSEGMPVASGEALEVDYWGRSARVDIVAGPWAAAYSEHLGLEVVLCRPVTSGEVVYGASVTLLTTTSMGLLEARLGRAVESERFRSTFLVDSGDLDVSAAPSHPNSPSASQSWSNVEDSWVGRELRIGDATVRVRGVVPRCAVVDLDPTTGQKDAPVLAEMARYRRGDGEISFGVDAVVTKPGRVHTGDQVWIEGT